MSRLSKTFCALTAVGIGLFSVPTAVSAFSLVNRADLTDAEFNNMRTAGEFTELFVAESRIGNNSLNTAERELGINTDTGAPVASGQRTWANGGLVNFMLQYTGSVVNYIVGSQTLTSTAFSGSVTDIFLRTRSAANSSMALLDLAFDGLGIGSLSSSGSDIDYLQISKISAPFTLTGKSMMSWTGSQPMRSNLAYQIKVGTTPQTESVPEPGTVAALLITGIAAAATSKRKKVEP